MPDKKQYYGVCKRLVLKARTALDACGMKHVKIIVSSGFDLNKIKSFVKSKIPVDIYGVGGSIVKVNVNITGDLIYLNNKQESKAGRSYKINQKTLKKLNIYI
ncbi:MAG: hypothetical protein MJ223_02165 [Mycoplasmoidaceae bacterium]|nr:hypothetical protein [Mycoplasmoidaceae bacterium]